MDLWIANQQPIEQVLPIQIDSESAIEQVLPDKIEIEPVTDKLVPNTTNRDTVLEEVLPIEAIKTKPFVLEGSVENFDPYIRAEDLAKTFPKRLCGTYKSFNQELTIPVELRFIEITPIGQIVSLKGQMLIGSKSTLVNAYLNAKSNQVELFVDSYQDIEELSSGGTFLSLNGPSLFGWQSYRLTNQGGRLSLEKSCANMDLKPLSVRPLW